MFSLNPLKWFAKKQPVKPVEKPAAKVTGRLQKSLSATGRNPTRPLPVPPAPPKRPDVRPIGAARRTDDDDLVWLQPVVQSSLYTSTYVPPAPEPEPFRSGNGGSFGGGGASASWDAPSPAPAPTYDPPAPSPSYDSGSSYSSSDSSSSSSSSWD
jgi:hypothetical protein